MVRKVVPRRGLRLTGLLALCLLVAAIQATACNPEPGPHHFPPFHMRVPNPPPPPLLTGIFEVFNTQNGLPCDRIRSLLMLPDRVLAGSDGAGLMEYHQGKWRTWNPKSSPPFPSLSVGALCQGDKRHQFWAGTPDGLVEIRYPPSGKPTFTLNPLSQSGARNVLCLALDGADLVAGTDAMGGKVSGDSFIPFRVSGNQSPTGYTSVGKSGNGEWFFGTEGGLFRIEGDGLQPFPRPDGDWGWVRALVAEDDLTVVGSSLGLTGWDEQGIQNHLPGVWITALAATRIRRSALYNPGVDFAAAELGCSIAEAIQNTTIKESKKTKDAREEKEKKLNAPLGAIEGERTWLADPANHRTPEFLKRAEKYEAVLTKILKQITQPPPEVQEATVALAKGLWAGTQNAGLVFFANDGIRRHYTAENSVLPANSISAIVTARSGETWIGTTEAGLLHYRPYTVNPATAPQPVWQGEVRALKVAGNLYVGTEKDGLLVFDPRSLGTTAHYHPGNVPGFHKQVNDVAVDARARLWVAGDEGVWMRDEKGWHRYDVGDRQASATAVALEARQQKLVAARDGGDEIHRQLAYFNGRDFTSYAPETVLPLLRETGTAAVSLTEQLGFRGAYLRSLNATDPAALARYVLASATDRITALCDTDQFLWLGTKEGTLFVFDGESFKELSAQGTGDMGPIVGIRQFPDETLLIAGQKRLLTFDGEHYKEVPLDGLPDDADIIRNVVQDDLDRQLFWVAYGPENATGGVALYQKPQWKDYPTGHEPVLHIGLSDPYIFYATPDGVFRLLK